MHFCLKNDYNYLLLFFLDYLQHIADAILYKLLSEADFSCTPLRFLTREILTEVILLPLISLVSDPDYINQTIIWLVRVVVLFGIMRKFYRCSFSLTIYFIVYSAVIFRCQVRFFLWS